MEYDINKKTIVRDKAMLNVIWCIMIAVAVIYAAFKGDISQLNNAILDAPGEGVTLCITMLGIMCLWMGIMEIADKSGLVAKLALLMNPLLIRLFPRIKDNSNALELIAANFAANIFGLGWAATPIGLKAMKALKECSNREDGVASDEMCTFLVINISSLQLIPITIIAYRNQYGSASPTAIILPALIATSVSTLTAIIFCLCMNKKSI